MPFRMGFLSLFEIPDDFFAAIWVNSTAFSTDGETTSFLIKAGILQSDILAPLLLIMVESR